MTPRKQSVLRVDLARSKALSRRIAAQDGDCFENAYRALLHVRGGSWVEGYVVTTFAQPVRHAWVETPTGRLLEVTPVHQPLENQYFPAHRLTLEEIRKRPGVSLGVLRWDRAMRAAYRKSLAAAGMPWPFPSGGVIRAVGEELVWFRSAAAWRKIVQQTKRPRARGRSS